MVTRRRVLGSGLTAVAAVSGTAAALWPVLTADPTESAASADAGGTAAVTNAVAAGRPLFDEVYRGRRIQGRTSASQDGIALSIDGRPLHVMRRVDGSWISMANHYQPYQTPLDTARGAVDVIGSAQLTAYAAPPAGGHHH
jgi:hypothetical protein